MEFLRALVRHSFLQYALLTGVLASVSSGIVGSYITARRISYVAAAIAHVTLAGMGFARYMQRVAGWSFMTPLVGAVVAALLSAVIAAAVTIRGREREDTVLSVIWSLGMAVGVLFISRTPGYGEHLMSYLFGNILLVGARELALLAALDVIVVGVALTFYTRFEAICFDEEYARLRGIRVQLYYTLLLCLTALTVVMLLTVVGIVMVIAMLTLPAAAASLLCRRLWHTMLVAGALSLVFVVIGLAVSYAPNLPAGATIIVVSGAGYALVHLLRRRRTA